jgi:hypothetical protein
MIARTFRRTLLSVLLATVGLIVGSPPAAAQTVVTSTTIASPLSLTNTVVAVTSATGITVTPQTMLFVSGMNDHELMNVVAVNGTNITVQRAINGTLQSAHNTGATLWVGPPAQFQVNGPPGGQCQATLVPYLPWIDVNTGLTYDCLGVTTAGQWTATNDLAFPVLGSTVASPAGLLTATGTTFTVSGTNAITGINVPNGWAAGMCLYVIPSGAFTWTTATNIGLAGTAVANKLIVFCWNGTKWFPSVVA